MKVKIRRELFDYLLELARSFHPNEFAGLLREKDGVFEEVLIVPKGYFGTRSVYFDLSLLPHDESIKGTVHSHPSPYPYPSQGDLMFFSKFGGVHVIIAFPYIPETTKAFTSNGEEIDIEIVD
ncbi:Mov34/MPN/PAD-1 family protein [Pyrococcus sp. ST04]|uniref:Mov34/MPN/PAD-1 family protein n=1 Tax=Pyrococcus sp. ST04 TaxID=1183377 RepID=UPI00026058DE|nr:Mov34/MPN/PAD-1 family protein [Pyrococcus sp. ST04]AFK22238.1 putative metalloprotease, containing Jab1/MPN domain [Pyrococcus sp. ST04]